MEPWLGNMPNTYDQDFGDALNLLETALSQWGEAERIGTESNPRILEYLRAAGLRELADETPWCGAFITWCAARCGITPPPLPAVARSWLSVGQPATDPKLGDIVVLKRGQQWQGHVGLFIRRQLNEVLVLGGNQSDRVGLGSYPFESIIGFRRITSAVEVRK